MANEVRLIDANALIARTDLHINIGAGDNICIDIADIAKAPTIDPETLRPKGRWVETVYSVHDGYTDEYSEEIYYDCIVCDYCSDWKSPYCPNCGADMRGDGE